LSGIALQASTGLVWFTDSLAAQVGSLDPRTGRVRARQLADCSSHPHDGLAIDPDGDIWWDEQFANALGELVE
jgi:streptogramin lyase